MVSKNVNIYPINIQGDENNVTFTFSPLNPTYIDHSLEYYWNCDA